MSDRRRIPLWLVSTTIWIAIVSILLFLYFRERKPLTLQGAAIVSNADPRQELPIPQVTVTVAQGLAEGPATTDASGFFSIRLRKGVHAGSPITLQFNAPNYQPLALSETATTDQLFIARMKPIPKPPRPAISNITTVANMRVTYSIKASTVVNIGSVVKTFEVANTGNIPCNGQHPCSPNGKWKAAIGSTSLDAESGNEFRDARVSCIAGPCPFTKIESDGFSKGGRNINVSARDWSDTATFLVEAEVVHPMVSDVTHIAYPVIFGRDLNFTLPAGAEGASIEIDLDGQTIIFPMGPALFLSWADCDQRSNRDQTKVYRCQLKPGYRFQ